MESCDADLWVKCGLNADPFWSFCGFQFVIFIHMQKCLDPTRLFIIMEKFRTFWQNLGLISRFLAFFWKLWPKCKQFQLFGPVRNCWPLCKRCLWWLDWQIVKGLQQWSRSQRCFVAKSVLTGVKRMWEGEGQKVMSGDEGKGGSRCPRKMMTFFMNSPLS